MLVLSRKTDEQIVIGDDIRVTVLRVKGRSVKLGIQAGDHVRVVRAELLDSPRTPNCPSDIETGGKIADPTVGFPGEKPAGEAQEDWVGACQERPGPSWTNSRPAWLTICCCS